MNNEHLHVIDQISAAALQISYLRLSQAERERLQKQKKAE